MANKLGNLKAERRGSMQDVEEMIKRKWEVIEGEGERSKGEEEGIFKRSNKISRSPEEKRNGIEI